jgi:hypothetical protein
MPDACAGGRQLEVPHFVGIGARVVARAGYTVLCAFIGAGPYPERCRGLLTGRVNSSARETTMPAELERYIAERSHEQTEFVATLAGGHVVRWAVAFARPCEIDGEIEHARSAPVVQARMPYAKLRGVLPPPRIAAMSLRQRYS